jgi:trans-2,3-dihydro-3-hydroxyanthranilate isomerase
MPAAEQVVWTSVFADAPEGGNPCPVVFDADHWTSEQMQARTAEFGVETVFVLPARDGGDVRLRYFVPRHEMQMCVHATVAATVLLARAGGLPRNPARIETMLGTRDVSWDTASATATVEQFVPQFGPVLTDDARARVFAALGLAETAAADDVGPICAVSTARPKLIVPVRTEQDLDALAPNYQHLWAMGDELDVTGFYPFTLAAQRADVAARQFPNRTGYNEDPATGVAACALAAYLAVHQADRADAGWRQWQIAQGRALGRPSLITAEAFVADSGIVSATRVGGAMRQLPETEHRRL